ncbi:MAG: exodeoxyribonuclease VII small subunit [Bacteroidales bacterium]|nr:exodeoxyribonuclease VII small subunit [Bacteroidales bacterium]
MSKKMTYKQAIKEIEEIINEIESGELDIDNITEKLNNAKKLFDFCKLKLETTKTSIENLLEEQE